MSYQENTLPALWAAEAEADASYAFIEFNVQYTKDKQIVLFHDRRLFRLFGKIDTVSNTSYADLKMRGREKDVMVSSISSEVIHYISTNYPHIQTGQIFWLTWSTYLHYEVLTEGLFEQYQTGIIALPLWLPGKVKFKA